MGVRRSLSRAFSRPSRGQNARASEMSIDAMLRAAGRWPSAGDAPPGPSVLGSAREEQPIGICIQELVEHAFAQVQSFRLWNTTLERQHGMIRREHDFVLTARVHEMNKLRREEARRVRRRL